MYDYRDQLSVDVKLFVGSKDSYRWVTSNQHSLHDIVQSCPEVLVGRYLAVTCTDSGDPKWWAGKLLEWTCRGLIAYSPLLKHTGGLQYQVGGLERPGFDEWYTFKTPTDLGEVNRQNPWSEESRSRTGWIAAFVNYYYYPSTTGHHLDKMFWDQMVRIQPESYISDGSDCVTFISKNSHLFDAVCACFRRAPIDSTAPEA